MWNMCHLWINHPNFSCECDSFCCIYLSIYFNKEFNSTIRRTSGTTSEWTLKLKLIQGRSKSKFNITYSYLIVPYFWVQGYLIPNYLEIKKILFKVSGFSIPKYLNWKLPEVLVISSHNFLNHYIPANMYIQD